MGQLIKLQDYVSRYEQDIYLYPSRYVRLKKQQWEKLRRAWESGVLFEPLIEETPAFEVFEEDNDTIMKKLKNIFKKDDRKIELEYEKEDADDSISFSFLQGRKIETIHDLKKQFLEQIFSFQIRWASTTLTEKSAVEHHFYYDKYLKYFLQRFPDTYLFMYKPIFQIKKAPVEVETILVTPTEVLCITFLEEDENDVFVGSKEHFWVVKKTDKESKILNPLIALDRTEKITRQILQLYDVDIEIKKIVLSRNGYIDYPYSPFDTTFISKRDYEEWFQKMRSNRSPLKHIQLKAAQGLLEYSQTTSRRRLEWDTNVDIDDI